MKRLIPLLIGIAVIMGLSPAPQEVRAQVEAGMFCVAQNPFPSSDWNVEAGTTLYLIDGTPYAVRNERYTVSRRNVIKVSRFISSSQQPERMAQVRYRIQGNGDNAGSPVYVYTRLYNNDVLVAENTQVFSPPPAISHEPLAYDGMAGFNNISADFIVVEVLQDPYQGNDEPGVLLDVTFICYDQTFPTPTPTPRPTSTPPPTATSGATPLPTSTKIPTTTPRPTSTPTFTRTFTPSPPPPASNTPTPTWTVGGPTETPSATPTDTNTPGGPTDTPQPTATVQLATLSSGAFSTPMEPDGECRDIFNPCALFPVPQIPTLELPSPTYIPTIVGPGNTPVATYTAYAPPISVLPGQDFDLRPLDAQFTGYESMFAGLLDKQATDGQGTPVSIYEGAHQIGASIGGLFGFARYISTADFGRVGQIITFLLLLIGFNIMLRVTIFVIPVLIAIGKLIIRLIDLIIQVLRFLIEVIKSVAKIFIPWLAVAIILLSVQPAYAQDPTATPTPTETPRPGLPTFTPSPTHQPLQPTPTDKYRGLRPTPTALNIQPLEVQATFETRQLSGQFADQVINFYRFLNFGHVMDFVSLVAMLIIVVMLLLRIQRRSTQNND